MKILSWSAFVRRKQRSTRGQGITEYGSVLAFVAFLVALAFSFAPGKLQPAVSACFSAVVDQINQNSAAAGGAS